MAEMVGFARGLRRPRGAVGGFFAALMRGLASLAGGANAPSLRVKEWPDYLLRDIGLDRNAGEPADPRATPTDWLMR